MPDVSMPSLPQQAFEVKTEHGTDMGVAIAAPDQPLRDIENAPRMNQTVNAECGPKRGSILGQPVVEPRHPAAAKSIAVVVRQLRYPLTGRPKRVHVADVVEVFGVLHAEKQTCLPAALDAIEIVDVRDPHETVAVIQDQ